MSDVITGLSALERQRLAELEAVIEAGQQTFLDVGLALQAIRDEKLYRPLTFAAYCEQRWNFTRQRGYQLLAAVEMSTAVDIPLRTERHARIVQALPEEHRNQVASLIADKPLRQAEIAAREYRERHGIGNVRNRHPRLVALAEELSGLEDRWTPEMCSDLTPPEARKQLRRIQKAILLLERARVAVEYRAATMHTWVGH